MTKFFSVPLVAAGFVTLILLSVTAAEDTTSTTPPAKKTSESGDAGTANPISLEIWVVSIRPSEKEPNTEQRNQLTTGLSNLQGTFASRQEVVSFIGRLESESKISKLEEYRVAAIEDHEAEVSVGWRKPRITATSITQLGTTNAIVIEPLGTLVHLTPHANSNGALRVQVKLETSMLLRSNDVPISVPSKGDSTFAQTAAAFQLNTEVVVKNGGATIVSMTPSQVTDESAVQLVILAANR